MSWQSTLLNSGSGSAGEFRDGPEISSIVLITGHSRLLSLKTEILSVSAPANQQHNRLNASGSLTGDGAYFLISTPHISSAYSRIVRSDENLPIRAVLSRALWFHSSGFL